jgi:PAP2 superfamily
MDSKDFVPGALYYCWVRVVSLSDQVTTSPVTRVDPNSPEDRRGDFHYLHWDLRARGVVPSKPLEQKTLGVWSAPRGLEGRDGADTAFDFGPAFVSEPDALDWLANTVPGRRWEAESINRLLLRFTHYAGPSGLKFQSPSEAEQQAEEMRRELKCDVSQAKQEFKFHDGLVSLKGPADYVSDPKAECATLSVHHVDRETYRAQIERESLNAYQAVNSVLSAMGLQNELPVYPALKAVCDYLLKEIGKPITDFKEHFKRARPWTCCEGGDLTLRPMLMLPDWRHPGHPAYPSGHATVAWTVAYFFGDIAPRFAPALERAAHQVALNREIAGVHYPSDSMAGKDLARQLVNLLSTSKDQKAVDNYDDAKKFVLAITS